MHDIVNQYKVSVSIITYNQVEYIQKAIDSAIAQETDFRYEIIIGDDYSTDGTREILLDYKEQYPELIKLNLQDSHDEKGIAGRKNNITNISSARGEYIAFLDGDDYWISKDKLQQQADFMDHNAQYSLCTCNALNIYEETNRRILESERSLPNCNSFDFTYRDIVKEEAPIIASSAFFRREYITPLPNWFKNVYLADVFLQLMALQHGPGRYFSNLKVGKVWTKRSICNQYLKSRMWIRVKKNDEIIIRKQFKNQEAKPYSYKAQFYILSAFRYQKQRKFMKMLAAVYKAYLYDPTLIAHWLKVAINKNSNAFKTLIYKLLYRFLKK